MKLLLTSAGITNKSITDALSELLAKPFSESNLVFIPTAANVEEGDKDWLIDNLYQCKSFGFKSIDIVDIALPKEVWQGRLEPADILLFGGGNTFYLAEQLEKAGLKSSILELLKTKVYVGISAGAQVASDKILVSSTQLFQDEDKRQAVEALGLVNFQFRPHLNSPYFPNVNKDVLTRVASEIKVPMYVLDDQSALKVVNGQVEVVSEGEYLSYNL
jgi:dipeptidase E